VLIDTHNHLDALEFAADRDAVIVRAAAAGVRMIVIPAVEVANFSAVQQLAQQYGFAYALGIHPLYTPQANLADLQALAQAAEAAMADPRFVAIGEIGLDFFVPALKEGAARERQEFFYSEQLKIARKLQLPVLLHVRRSQDTLLGHLRRIKVPGGLAHAFNGSAQQADNFIALGFKLGFGGAATYPRALQIRRLWTSLPQDSVVLETDSPDMAPSWAYKQRNEPAYLAQIAQELAQLRGLSPAALALQTQQNALAALPRLQALLG
jgi:TatD DNase family protein